MYRHKNETHSNADSASGLETFQEKISKDEDVVDLQMEQNKTINDIIGTTFKDLTFPCQINSAILDGIAKYAIEELSSENKNPLKESKLITSENGNEIKNKATSPERTSHVGNSTNEMNTEAVQDPVTSLENNLINLQLEQNSLALKASDDILKLLPADLATDFFQSFQENLISVCAMENSDSDPTSQSPNNITVGDENDTKSQQDDHFDCRPSNSNDSLKRKPEAQNDNSSEIQQSELLPLQLEQNSLIVSSSVIPSEISHCLSEEMNQAIRQALNKNIQIVSDSSAMSNPITPKKQGRNGVLHVDHFEI